jgi:type II secretory pathway component GspD/PulD (secretin)
LPTTPGAPGAAGQAGTQVRANTLRFVSPRKGGAVQSGLLEDIRITPDIRINAVIISAPERTMELLLSMINTLDVPPRARAEVNIFPLKKADATNLALTIQQLFLGVAGGAPSAIVTPPAAPGGGPTGGPGGGPTGGPGGGPTGGPGGIPSGVTPGTGVVRPLILTIGRETPEGVPLIELRVTVDVRTNSLIVAGSRNDLDVIDAIVTRLEDADVQVRQNEVYWLHNSTAIDLANALNNFITGSLQALSRGQYLTAYQDFEREVVVVPEPISNKLLINATPRYMADILRLIEELDAELPQVVIQVLVAEVDLSGNEEFGVEFGLQSPVLFRRSIVPDPGFIGPGGTIAYTNTSTTFTPVGFPVPPGVAVSSTINPWGNPGFHFTNAAIDLGNNPVVDPGVVGFQGITNLGVGRTSSVSNVGGFVFSANSSAFSLLIRALKVQGRIDLLSRPQIMTLDNQAARVAVGQSVPYIAGTTLGGGGLATTNVVYRDVGVILNVLPKISPDGKVVMRVTPEISSVSPIPQQLGNGQVSPIFNQQLFDTTVIAQDGETVALGGLITRSDTKNENKVPWFGDLPYVGSMFRYRTQQKKKVELLVIMTPHIVRNKAERSRILAMESARMDWIVGDVVKTQGISGMNPIFHPRGAPSGPPPGSTSRPGTPPAGRVDGALPSPLPGPAPTLPQGPSLLQGPPAPPGPSVGPGSVRPAPQSGDTLPLPRPVPSPVPVPPAAPAAVPAAERPLGGLTTLKSRPAVLPPVPAGLGQVAPVSAAVGNGKEANQCKTTGIGGDW